MISASAAVKRHRTAKPAWETNLPEFDPSWRVTSLSKTLYYFRSEVDESTCRKIASEFLIKNDRNPDRVKAAPDFAFIQIAALANLFERNLLSDSEVLSLHARITKLFDDYSIKPKRVVEVVKRTVQDNVHDLAAKFAADIDAELDTIWESPKTEFDVKTFLVKHEVSAPIAKALVDYYKPIQLELNDVLAKKDDQLVEAYQHKPKRAITSFRDAVDAVIAGCSNAVTLAKHTRAPRKRKAKPAGVVAAKVRYMRDLPELKLKSEPAEKVVGASEVWCYNHKYRKLTRYVAQDGMTLTWKGTTLQNWCPEQSGGHTIRKPGEFISAAIAMTKRPLAKAFNAIRGAVSKPTGRVSDDVLLFKVFQ